MNHAVLIKDGAMTLVDLAETCEALQAMVDGYFEQFFRKLISATGRMLSCWCNEEFLLRDWAPNIIINRGFDDWVVIHGPVVITCEDAETGERLKMLPEDLTHIELIIPIAQPDEPICHWIPNLRIT